MHTKFSSEIIKEGDHLEDPGTKKRITPHYFEYKKHILQIFPH
jgi:hypothetical protein